MSYYKGVLESRLPGGAVVKACELRNQPLSQSLSNVGGRASKIKQNRRELNSSRGLRALEGGGRRALTSVEKINSGCHFSLDFPAGRAYSYLD